MKQTMAPKENSNLHIVVFPWLAFGHMLPFLELSKALARKGHKISFISTPRNLQRLPKLPSQISDLIDLIPLSLSPTDGLREAAEATTDLPPEEVPYLKKAFDSLEQPFRQFIEQTSPKPDWIIQDFIQHWMPKIGDELSIPCVFYFGVPAADLVFYGPMTQLPSRTALESFTVAPPWVPFPTKMAYKLHEVRRLSEMTRLPNPSGVPDMHRFKMALEGCRAIALRSCEELESEWLILLEEIIKKPIVPVGLLPPSVDERNENVNESEVEIMEWLGKQRSKAVVYVALGTEVAMNTELLHELALGLEMAKLPFVWGLRKPFGLSQYGEILPKGFEDRTKDFGLVVKGWVPQVKILAHESVGGFLTHCGWSSIVEGLQSGHPLVLLPVDLDQGLNARLMEEKGFGVEVERNEEDGCFSKEDVAKALRLVMVDEEGESYRKRAREMMEVVQDKEWQDKDVDDLIQFLVTNRNLGA